MADENERQDVYIHFSRSSYDSWLDESFATNGERSASLSSKCKVSLRIKNTPITQARIMISKKGKMIKTVATCGPKKLYNRRFKCSVNDQKYCIYVLSYKD